ncbi:unnamed protein product [Symbiodinium sp. CCMP2592]|nr:unnamed protein product [Symbiodinium sp. CCMP2592]
MVGHHLRCRRGQSSAIRLGKRGLLMRCIALHKLLELAFWHCLSIVFSCRTCGHPELEASSEAFWQSVSSPAWAAWAVPACSSDAPLASFLLEGSILKSLQEAKLQKVDRVFPNSQQLPGDLIISHAMAVCNKLLAWKVDGSIGLHFSCDEGLVFKAGWYHRDWCPTLGSIQEEEIAGVSSFACFELRTTKLHLDTPVSVRHARYIHKRQMLRDQDVDVSWKKIRRTDIEVPMFRGHMDLQIRS